MSDEILEPTLTASDRKVLAAVPANLAMPATANVWQIGEQLGILDLEHELLPVLNGLHHLGYVGRVSPGGRVGWWRTARGDEAVGSS